jgi:hypothetical protein
MGSKKQIIHKILHQKNLSVLWLKQRETWALKVGMGDEDTRLYPPVKHDCSSKDNESGTRTF